jgi:outer membrane protein assembly factor BamD
MVFEESVAGPRYDQGSTREALSFYDDFLILHRNHPRVAEAEEGALRMRTVLAQSKIELGDWYFRHRSNYTAARVFYNEAITAFPNSEVAETARRKIAEVDAAEAEAIANPPSNAWRWINWLWR